MTRRTSKKEKGITLVALVVTIIILLILAAVTISLVVGQGGLLQRAKDSGNIYKKAEANESNELDEYGQILGNVAKEAGVDSDSGNGGNSGPTGDTTDYSTALYEHYKNMNYEQVEGANTIDETDATWLFDGAEEDNYPDYIEYKGQVYVITYTDSSGDKVKEVEKVNTNVDFNTFGVYQIDGTNILITPSTKPEHLIHTNFTQGTYTDEEGNEFEGYCAYDNDGYNRIYDTSGALVLVDYRETLGSLSPRRRSF